jgi:ATP-grasp domain
VACLLGDHPTGLLDDGRTIVPEFPFPEEAALALARVTGYASWRAKPVGDVLELDGDAVERARALVGGALEANPDGVRLGPLDADRLVRTAGMTLVDQRVVDGGDDDVVAAARELGYPVAVKAGGLVQLSRTEAGGVSLDVHGDDEVRRAHTRMSELLGPAMTPTVVQRMLPEGLESRIALHRHPVLGDVISLGAGGSVAEQFDGLALHILPLTDCDADRLITAATIGSAVDALGPGARAALADVLLRLSALAECVPEIAGVRLNPVLVSADGHAEITDVRIDLLPVPPDTRPPVRRL